MSLSVEKWNGELTNWRTCNGYISYDFGICDDCCGVDLSSAESTLKSQKALPLRNGGAFLLWYDLGWILILENLKMTDEELKELVASLAVAQKKTDETLRSVGIQLGNMSRNQGDVAEEFFFNSLAHDTHLGAIHFDDIAKNEHKRRGKTEEEYDIVMTNGNAIGIVEVKYKAHINDLEKLERKMKNFKTLFPWFENYKLYGAMASFHINDDAKNEALNRGFFVLQRSGDLIHTDAAESLLVL